MNLKISNPMTPKEAQALKRLLQVALSNTGQSRLIGNFLLAWWNADACGGFALNDLWGLDDALRVDVLTIMGFIARHQRYPDTLGLAEEFEQLIQQWRPTLLPPPTWQETTATDGNT